MFIDTATKTENPSSEGAKYAEVSVNRVKTSRSSGA
jgi:hypothetical protein